jgi:PAS domain S-box-containing protein
MPFYSGWDGWWRMNALGLLTVVPAALTWFAVPRKPMGPRAAWYEGLLAGGIAGLLVLLMRIAPPSTAGVLLVNLVLPIVLYAAVRIGPRGAASAGALAAIVVAVAASHGIGPFSAVPLAERHTALQLFELTVVTFPLVIGALIAERQAALAKGLESEERRNSIQQALPDVAYRIREDGLCVDLYVPTGKTGVFSHPQAVGRHVREFLPADLAGRLQETIRQVLREHRSVTVEYELVLEGRQRIREARCLPYGPDEILAVVRDITERKRAEAMVAFEARVLELVATGCSTRQVFSEIVQGMERLTRDGLCSIILLNGKFLHVAMAPSLPESLTASMEGVETGPEMGSCGAAAALGRSIVVEDIATHPLWTNFKQHALPLGLRACWSVPICDSAGQVLGTFAVYYREPRTPDPEELTLAERAGALAGIAVERERRSEALRRSEDLLASINRNVNEGLFRATPDLRLVYVNRAFARMFGFDSPDDLLDTADPGKGNDFGSRVALEQLILEHGSIVDDEASFRRRDGSLFWGLVSSTAVRGTDGTIAYYDGVIADITARKELEKQFRQSQKMEAVGKLAGGIAHDFNNLLTAIYGYTESIQKETGPGAPVAAHAEGVMTAARRAASLTRQLLAFSRQQVLSPQVLELASVVEQLGGMLRRLIGEDIQLVLTHTSTHSRVRVDRGQLEQVIVNLVVNARDAMPGGGILTLSTEAVVVDEAFAHTKVDLRPGLFLALCVRDTGEGMPRDVQAQAFDPFFTTKEQGRGTGLGLSTVYGIIKQSGGAVWLDSQPGAGTSVWIYLPQVEADLDLEKPLPQPSPPAFEVTVLVVEDEPVVRELVCESLRRAGYAVLEAGDGREALQVSRGHDGVLNLVVTDVVMPHMGGRELAGILFAERPGVKVLFMSGYSNDGLDLRDFESEDTDFIPKPFTASDLIERTRSLLHPGVVGA